MCGCDADALRAARRSPCGDRARRIAGFDSTVRELGATSSSPWRASGGRRRSCRGRPAASRCRRSPWRNDGRASGTISVPPCGVRSTFGDERVDELVLVVAGDLLAQELLGRAGGGRGHLAASAARARARSRRRSAARRRASSARPASSAASRMRFLSASASARMPSTSFLTSASTSLMRVSYSASFFCGLLAQLAPPRRARS